MKVHSTCYHCIIYTEGGAFPDKLQEAHVPLWPDKFCRDAIGNGLTDNMICAGYDQFSVDACQVRHSAFLPVFCVVLQEHIVIYLPVRDPFLEDYFWALLKLYKGSK